MRNYILTFLLTVLVVLASVSVRNALGMNSAAADNGSTVLAIGPGPAPMPPGAMAIGPGPAPMPPGAKAIGPGPAPMPPGAK
jgi:hypothetical protein